mgnify:CR=1 FL=1
MLVRHCIGKACTWEKLKVSSIKIGSCAKGIRIEEIGFDNDHLHMVMVIPPKYSISDVMRDLKSQSTVYLRKKFVFLDNVYWKENIFWSPGFFVSSVGVDEETIMKYVQHQGQEDSGQIELDL